MKEATIQNKVVTSWRKLGYEAIKLTTMGVVGVAGWPDFLFLGPKGRMFFIEFKAPGNTCTELQLHRQAILRKLGYTVYVCDNAGVGIAICAKELTGRTS